MPDDVSSGKHREPTLGESGRLNIEFVALLDVRCECSKELMGPLSCFVVGQAVFSTSVDLECVVSPNRESVVVNLPVERSERV